MCSLIFRWFHWNSLYSHFYLWQKGSTFQRYSMCFFDAIPQILYFLFSSVLEICWLFGGKRTHGFAILIFHLFQWLIFKKFPHIVWRLSSWSFRCFPCWIFYKWLLLQSFRLKQRLLFFFLYMNKRARFVYRFFFFKRILLFYLRYRLLAFMHNCGKLPQGGNFLL